MTNHSHPITLANMVNVKKKQAYQDSQIQGTNDSSILSKRSVEAIYGPVLNPDATRYLELLLPKAKRRSPGDNRVFWIRMETVKRAISSIASKYPKQKIRVINLGCGFDSLAFELISLDPRFECLDFDYPDLAEKKSAMIRNVPEILDTLGAQIDMESLLGTVWASQSYKLVGCDLKDADLFHKQIDALLDNDGAAIFLAEVSLAYMVPEDANRIVQICGQIPNAHFLSLEQILPAGKDHFFAQKMLYHFGHLLSPLQCVEAYPSKEKQLDRFSKYFHFSEVLDLFEAWEHFFLIEEKRKVALVEDFDEWEELILYCQHYIILHATVSEQAIFPRPNPEFELPCTEPISLTCHSMDLSLNLKFPAASSSGAVYVHGGLSQTRTDQLLKIEHSISVVTTKAKPSPRMSHCMVSLDDGTLLLIGGRTRPGFQLSDVWLFSTANQEWSLLGNMPESMSRHSAVCISTGKALVFANGKFWEVTKAPFTVTEVATEGHIPLLKSYCIVYDSLSKTGYVIGGMENDIEPRLSGAMYKFVYGDTIAVSLFVESSHLARISAMAKLIESDLYLMGGTGKMSPRRSDTILKISLSTEKVYAVPISDTVWKTFPVFVGSQLAGNTIVGGGAVCYTFGSSYNKTYTVDF